MEILAALFFEGLELRPASGGVTKIDLTGIHFSMAAPTPVPITVAPHLMVLVHCPEGASPTAALEVIFTCLLYTSPSPRDQRGSRMPSSA